MPCYKTIDAANLLEQGKETMIERISILGTGLLGTSVGLALRAAGFRGSIVGWNRGAEGARLALEAFGLIAGRHPDLRLKLCGGGEPGTAGELDFPGSERVRASSTARVDRTGFVW